MADASTRPSRRNPWLRAFLWLLAGLLTLLLVLGAGSAWLIASESGLRRLAGLAERFTGGKLTIEAPHGRLVDDWSVDRLRWQDEAQTITVDRLAVRWSPLQLRDRHLQIERLAAASLRVDRAPSTSNEPAALPESLKLPLSVNIEQLELGRVLLGETGSEGKSSAAPSPIAESIAAKITSDGTQHRIDALQATLGKLGVTASAAVNGEQPFALDAKATIRGTDYGQQFSVEVDAGGSLAKLEVDGRASSSPVLVAGNASTENAVNAVNAAPVTGNFTATLTPFASTPVSALRVQLAGVDPAAFVDGAPEATLAIDVVIDELRSAPPREAENPSANAASPNLRLGGTVTVTNLKSGPLDRELLPVERVQTRLAWADETLRLSDLTIAVTGGGAFSGDGQFADGQLALDLEARAIDAQALHASLLPTKLAGALQLNVGDTKKTLDVDLRDARYALKAKASLGADAVELSGVELTYEKARLQAAGRLELAGDGRFSAKGSLQDFDPARFVAAGEIPALPKTRLTARFSAEGALRPELQVAADFDLKDSRINDQPLSGKGSVDVLGERLRKVTAAIDVAGNQLRASGAFGKAGDRLRLQVQAPKLAALGIPDISGDASADLSIGGSLAQPELVGDVKATRLRLADLLDVRDASLQAEVGGGAQGAVNGSFRCAACSLPGAGVPPLAIDLTADGVRTQHEIRARVGLPAKRLLRLTLNGGLQEFAASSGNKKNKKAPPASGWQGRLAQFSIGRGTLADGGKAPGTTKPMLELQSAAPLRLAPGALAFGPAKFAGSLGELQVTQLSQASDGLQSSGRWQGLRVQTLLTEFPELASMRELLGPQTLAFSGEWTVTLPAATGKTAAEPSGQLSIRREAGDLKFGALELGLREAQVQASLQQGRLSLTADVHGTRLGDVSGQVEVPKASKPGVLFDPQARLQGRLQARVPDLSWLMPLLGEGWNVAGQLDGEIQLAGTLAKPTFSGRVLGEKLALRALDWGMRLENGKAEVEITPEKLLLRSLAFDSELSRLPRLLQLDPNIKAQQLTGQPGRLEASGEFLLSSDKEAGRLRLKLDRVGILQKPDQWIAVSGEGEVSLGDAELVVGGKFGVDAGLWQLADAGRPSLSDDVVIHRDTAKPAAAPARRALRLDVMAALGRSFHFRGAGVESRLAGQLRIRSDDAGLPRATGSINTADGRFDAYGQKLDITRGIVNFQGAIDNPGLNILAVRKNLPVEAGVEVTGTAQRPQIRLVSTPNVPDTEKLSWLVLGRAPDEQGSDDSSLLFAAAQTIFGGQGGGFLSRLQSGLGIDEFGIASGQLGGSGRQATSRVANTSGFGQSQTVNGQIVSIGKRLSANALLSYEQSLATTESLVKLTYNLSKQFSVVGRAGTDSALDFFWHFRFGK